MKTNVSILTSPTPAKLKPNNKLILSSVNLKKKMVNTWVISSSQDRSLSLVESSSLSAKLVSMGKLTLPPGKTEPESTPVEMLWSMIPPPRKLCKIVKLPKIKINLSVRSVSNKLRILTTSYSTLVCVQVHVEQSIWNAWPNGYTSRSKNKSSAVRNITTSRNSSVKWY